MNAALLAKHFGSDYEPEHFSMLDNFNVCVKQLAQGIAQDPFHGFTEIFAAPETAAGKRVRYVDPAIIVRQSRRHYAEHRSVIEAKIARWVAKELPPSRASRVKEANAMDAELRRRARAAARPRARGGKQRPTKGSGFAHISQVIKRT